MEKEADRDGKSVSKEISPFWIGHILVAVIAGSIVVASLYNLIIDPESVSWSDLWQSLGGTLIVLLFAGFSHIVYRGQDPEIEASRYKIRGRYILRGPKSWEYIIRFSTMYLLVFAGTFFLISMATLIVLLVT